MSLNLYITCLVLLPFALVASAAPTLPPVRVPSIRLNGFTLEPTIYGHMLFLTKPESTVLDESFVEEAPGQVKVFGRFEQAYEDQGKLELTYNADKNGYVAKYTYKAGKVHVFLLPLSPNVYRSLAG